MTKEPLLDSNNLERFLITYGTLVVTDWANLQPGQPVLITADRSQSRLVEIISEQAKALRNCGSLHIYWKDVDADLERLTSETVEELGVADQRLITLSGSLVEQGGCLIGITEAWDPKIFESIPAEKLHALERAKDQARVVLRKKGLGENRITRCLLAAANRGWAQMLFPKLTTEEAYIRLWNEIFNSCFVLEDNPSESFRELENVLARSRDKLQRAQLRALRFQGPGTDLTVPLSSEAIWLSGEKQNRDGINYFANVPIGEIFTTPDFRYVQGEVRCTMPTVINEMRVSDIALNFRDGMVVEASASEGEEVLNRLLESDLGAGRLGEIALVGSETPLSQSDVLFHEILLDEKGRSHLALGMAYRNCIRNGASLSEEEAYMLGINDSIIHHDFMIGDSQTNVDGITDNGLIPIMRGGVWSWND